MILLEYDKFKSKFISQSFRQKSIAALKSALDKAVKKELPSRDNKKIFIIRDICNGEHLHISCNTSNLMCKYSPLKEKVVVGVLAPAWSYGWKRFLKVNVYQSR